jgi:hypothetical protein
MFLEIRNTRFGAYPAREIEKLVNLHPGVAKTWSFRKEFAWNQL